MKTSKEVIAHVLKKPGYALVAVSIALFLFILTNLFVNLSLLWSSSESLSAKWMLFQSLVYGIFVSQPLSTVFVQGVLVSLIGINS